MTATLTPDLTHVPARNIPAATDLGNTGIGPEKINGRETVDWQRELDMPEENYLRDAVIYLMRYLGPLATGESKDALPTGILSARDTLARLGNGNPGLYRYVDHFEYRSGGAFDGRWSAGGSWATVSGIRGIAQAPCDALSAQELKFQDPIFYRASLPCLNVRVKWDAVDTAPVVRLGFRSTDGNSGFGVEMYHTSSAYFRAYTLIGGSYTYTASTVEAVALSQHDVRVWITGAVGSQTVHALIDGTAVSAVATANLAKVAWSPLVYVGSGSDSGKLFTLDVAAIEADFSKADS